MKRLMTTGAITTAVVGVVVMAGAAFAATQAHIQKSRASANHHPSASGIVVADHDAKETIDHDHMDRKHEGHMDGDGHMHKKGEKPHHDEEGHQHKDGDVHAHHKDGHAEHKEHMKKGSDAK